MASLGDLSRLLATPSGDTEKWAALTTCFMGEPAGQGVAERKAQSLVLHSLSRAVRAAQPLIISRWARGIRGREGAPRQSVDGLASRERLLIGQASMENASSRRHRQVRLRGGKTPAKAVGAILWLPWP